MHTQLKQKISTRHAAEHVPGAVEARQQQIATAAYLRAQARGFEPGHELEDWLEAERSLSTAEERGRPMHHPG